MMRAVSKTVGLLGILFLGCSEVGAMQNGAAVQLRKKSEDDSLRHVNLVFSSPDLEVPIRILIGVDEFTAEEVLWPGYSLTIRVPRINGIRCWAVGEGEMIIGNGKINPGCDGSRLVLVSLVRLYSGGRLDRDSIKFQTDNPIATQAVKN